MSLPICKYFSSHQTCRFGKHCRFSHILPQRPPSLPQSTSDINEDGSLKYCNLELGTELAAFSDRYNHDGIKQDIQPENAHLIVKEGCERSSSEQDARKPFSTQKTASRACLFFANGWCKYGRNCAFSHNVPNPRANSRTSTCDITGCQGPQNINLPPRLQKSRSNPCPRTRNGGAPESQGPQNIDPSLNRAGDDDKFQGVASYLGKQSQLGKLCAYFKAGQCKRGRNCKFVHQIKLDELRGESGETSKRKEKEERGTNTNSKILSKPEQKVGKPELPLSSRQILTLVQLDEVGICEVRRREIESIRRRFPKDKFVLKEDGERFVATIKFIPSDPDWPFDVKEFEFEFTVPEEYPKQTLDVKLSLEQDLPVTVKRYLEVSVQEWLHERKEQQIKNGTVELVFRPFLRWLDKNIEDLTTEALKQLKRELTAKSMGLEFIPAKKLQERFHTVSESSVNECKEQDASEEDDGTESGSDDDDESGTESSEADSEEEKLPKGHQSLELQPQQKGTEISLKYLQLKENAAALMFQRLKVILQCGRCKGHEDVHVSEGSVTNMACGKCNNSMYVTFRPGLLHQFSSVLGYLDVDGCQAFDIVLQDCRACVSCMACNKQTTIDGLVTGQLIDGWCKACNAKFKLATEAVKLTHLAPSGVDTAAHHIVEVASSKVKKPPKDPSIKEGYPLPEFGTCKHYKHSYRWLRFPCCGKAYPCDVCHDKKEDHEMTLANRMICGHCCKEQNYSGSRPCTGCGQHVTKVRSAHWEGGSGCRDKISMSKGDIHKYKNMNKTVSKKKLEAKPKKKTTKLRHA